MATIVLQVAGAYLGNLLGGAAVAIGQAAGALAGYAIDRALLGGSQRQEGPRLTGARYFTAEEGASLPRVYGTVRTGGTLIWATRFEEVATTRRQGFKGGPRLTEYSYFANAAFAIAEGPVSAVRRIWVDGRELDRSQFELRVYSGGEELAADPLIEAKQGSGNAPAYRGTAYIVVDRFPLGDYGNRLPQFEFEVVRVAGTIADKVRAVTLIPGSTEFGLSPHLVTRELRPGEEVALNRHVLQGSTDLTASLDELQALCPNLDHVGLVVTWFGDDLRAGNCRIRPMVTDNGADGFSEPWAAGGLSRATAHVVSQHGGGAAYGGSPSDRSVVDAITEIKARGLKVTLYPFIMMDVPSGNALPNPYGGTGQPAYPWRGRITASPAPGQPGSADKTSAARTQLEAFCGEAAPGDFTIGGGAVSYAGDPGDWGYRRFLLHFAHVAAAAGGVDAFLLGSELRGLTTLRDGANAFPFVEALCTLADEVRDIVGPATKITYGADWTEYFGHQPADGSGDVYFHLDTLWAHTEVNAVGIDNYMPAADWRDADYAGGNPDDFAAPYDPAGLRRGIASGEGFDWFYANLAARNARSRTAITDGAYGKPWVFRYKDLAGWWSNQHFNRSGGVQAGSPTAWAPKSKPFWLTELGCPAVDKGPNQPNVFPDPKSSESASPYFSGGGRSDLAQRRFIAAHQEHWDPTSATFDAAKNPLSGPGGFRMVDVERIYLWSWDARPFLAFPQQGDAWRDGGNWALGHWLNGRLSGLSVGELINAILTDHGLPPADVDRADGSVTGYIIADPATARSALEPLTGLFGLAVIEDGGSLIFRSTAARVGEAVSLTELAAPDKVATIERTRSPDHQLPASAMLGFRDVFREHQAGSARAERPGAGNAGQETFGFSGVLETAEAETLVRDWLRRRWSERERVSFAVSAGAVDVAPGARIRLPAEDAEYLVTEVEEGLVRNVSALAVSTIAVQGATAVTLPQPLPPATHFGKPHCLLLDLPLGPGGAVVQDQFRIAAWARPWRAQRVWASPETTGFTERALLGRPATVGRLTSPLASGFEGRIDRVSFIEVELFDGELASVSRLQLLNGANLVAIRSLAGAWEIVQFEEAQEIAASVWRLTGLLRGQAGTTDAVLAGAADGADAVLLDEAVRPAGLAASEIGLTLTWRAAPAGQAFVPGRFFESTAVGGLRARLPLSPVHLKAKRQSSGDLAMNWIRRGRIDADDWEPSDIPLGEETEAYRVEVAPAGGAAIRSATVTTQSWTYPATSIAADFASLPADIDITVRQISASAGPGVPARMQVTLT